MTVEKIKGDPLENFLRSLLNVRYMTVGFIGESNSLRLVAFNAKVSSSRLKESGRTLSVLTDEISDLTFRLRSLVQHICDLIKEITHKMAVVTNNKRNGFYLERALGRFKQETGQTRHLVTKSFDVIQSRNTDSLGMVCEELDDLIEQISQLNYYTDSLNAVRMQLIVESSNLSSDAGDSTMKEDIHAFEFLAESILSSCDEMKRVRNESLAALMYNQKNMKQWRKE